MAIKIVLDPGHGGENHGLEYDGFLEKEMNHTVAGEIKKELEKYEEVEVYITNPECGDMSLKQRAEYAKSVEADVLISLHFNMSDAHRMFGSEVWVPSAGENHAWMHSFGDIFLEELSAKGFMNKGVKTRLNGKGTDYYGIIRESTALGIPSLLVEHCYADAQADAAYLKKEGSLQELAVSDATAIAKFYGLRSESLGVDYSTYVKNAYPVPESVMGPDETAPEDVQLYYVSDANGEGEKTVTFLLQARETQSRLCYYEYSLDDGASWSDLYAWEDGKDRVIFEAKQLPEDARVTAKVYNGYFEGAQSNVLAFQLTHPAVEEEGEAEQDRMEEMPTGEILTQAYRLKGIGWGIVVCAVPAVVILLVLYIRHLKTKKRERRQAFLQAFSDRENGIQARLHKRKKQLWGPAVMGIFLCVLVGVILIHAGDELLYHKDLSQPETAEETSKRKENGEEPETVQAFHEQTGTPVYQGNRQFEMSQAQAQMYLEQTSVGPDTETVYDIQRGYLRVNSLSGVERNSYDMERITEQNGYKYYTDEAGNILSEAGVDVSQFQGDIDWEMLKQSGISFAMLRAGFRGYGSGKLMKDEKFEENVKAASAQGIKIGVYFFSAAVDEEEAVEEADYVAGLLQGHDIQMPVVIDTEAIYYDDARTDDLTPSQLTAIIRAFCGRIREYGYTPMIYANAKRLTCVLHLEELSDIEVWYADYQEKPIYPYAYRMWQYTEHGNAPGIEAEVDLNVYFRGNY
ncbi:MAG: hypothetical protein E7294_07230 [Lachnospiraceae bacterium]|nr:hypothetical protein [Lachnospiraceae bacterium]